MDANSKRNMVCAVTSGGWQIVGSSWNNWYALQHSRAQHQQTTPPSLAQRWGAGRSDVHINELHCPSSQQAAQQQLRQPLACEILAQLLQLRLQAQGAKAAIHPRHKEHSWLISRGVHGIGMAVCCNSCQHCCPCGQPTCGVAGMHTWHTRHGAHGMPTKHSLPALLACTQGVV